MSVFFPTTEDGRLTRRLRIAVVNAHGVLGGAESWLLSMLDAAADRLDVRAILLEDGPLRHALCERNIPVTLRATGAKTGDIVTATWWVSRQLKRYDPDVVLANGVKAATVACPAARLTGVRSVWAKHDHSFDGMLSRFLGKLSTKVVSTAAEVGAPSGRSDVVIIPPPKPAEPFHPDTARAILAEAGIHLPPFGNTLAMVGRFAPYKNIDVAIHALVKAEKWHLLAMGADDPAHPHERQRLSNLATQLGVSDRVFLAPYLPHASQLLSSVDALAMLTAGGTVGREGYSMAAVEGMTAHLPIIAIDDDGPTAQRIKPDQSGAIAGLRIAPRAPEQLAEALANLEGPILREAIGAEGRRRVDNTPDAATCGDQFAALCSEVALRPGAGIVSGPPLSVIVPIFNEETTIRRLLDLLLPQLEEDDELILIDGGSTDATSSIIATYSDSRIKLIDDRNGNIAHSRNVGIRSASHSFVACTDAGCDPGPRWLASFRAAAAELERSPSERGMVLGVYHTACRNLFERAMAAVAWADPVELRRPTPLRRLYGKLLGRWFLAHRVEGRSVGFTVKAFEAAGGFPENLPTAEDEAFGKNLIKAGFRSIHSLDTDVVWYQREGVAATFRQFRGYGAGGGTSRSALLLARDLARVAGYVVAVLLPVLFGTAGAVVTLTGAAFYMSTPLARLWRRGHQLWLTPLLPFCYLLKDIAKVTGTISALIGQARGYGRRHGG